MAKDLDEYRRKRDFTKTTEPRPAARRRSRAGPVFVIHRHEARNLHYDLRLEDGPALKSWAVPRGFSYIPKDKRLAVRTEDHPMEYTHFEGVIPKGQYGAGTMTIWDRGRFDLYKDGTVEEAIASGKIEFRLFGKRLRGDWHMVKTAREQNGWLLFKSKDRYARGENDRPYPFDIDLDRASKRSLPRKLVRMEPRRSVAPFSDPAWLFELEIEGRRLFLVKRGKRVTLKGAPASGKAAARMASLLEGRGDIRAENAVLDGVLVALDEGSRPSRKTLDERLEGKNETPLCFYAFDLLYYDEWYVGGLPLVERKRLLAALLPGSSTLLNVEHVPGEGEKLADVVSQAGLGGVIAKKASSDYEAGESGAWRRVRVTPSPAPVQKDLLKFLRSSRRGKSRYGRVRYSNREKVFWPDQGYTKGDLLDYYERIAAHVVPYLHERPLHMRRFPDGIGGKSFYHHNAPAHVPDWLTTESIRGASDKKAVRYIICNDKESLLYVINLGSIDLHPWMSRRGSLDTPDWLILDLDPDGSPFAQVVKVARAIGKLLRGIGLRPYLKTSGASGIHISVPLLPRYTYDQARMFGEGVARHLVREHPDDCTVERIVGQRQGRVYIDYMQNRRGQTIVPPYVARPVAAASVSTPLDWDELSSEMDPASFTIETVPERVGQVGDLFQPTLTDRQDLLPAIEAFRELVDGPSP